MQKTRIINRYYRKPRNPANYIIPAPMADPVLLDKVFGQGFNLEDTPLTVLGLKNGDLKRLKEVGINNLEQLAKSNDTIIFAIPHFGVMRVNNLKTALKSYFCSILQEPYQQSEKPFNTVNLIMTNSVETEKRLSTDPQLEVFSASLQRVEKRIINLESRLTRIKNSYLKFLRRNRA